MYVKLFSMYQKKRVLIIIFFWKGFIWLFIRRIQTICLFWFKSNNVIVFIVKRPIFENHQCQIIPGITPWGKMWVWAWGNRAKNIVRVVLTRGHYEQLDFLKGLPVQTTLHYWKGSKSALINVTLRLKISIQYCARVCVTKT